jgi:subtilisin family serine protease
VPLTVVTAVVLVAACAPATPQPSVQPAPTTTTTPASQCPVGAAAAADLDGAGGASSDADSASDPEVVVVAIDDQGRPEIVTTEFSDAVRTGQELEADPDIEVVAIEPDHEMTVQATGPDPHRPSQWSLDDLAVETLWSLGTGTGIDVAVVDTGVHRPHVDLNGRVCAGVAFLGSTGQALLGQGETDGNGHGTHVAGTIAAAANDGTGVAGVAPSTRILPVKVLGDNGSGSSSDVARGITWAVDNGAEIINLSLGGSFSSAVATAVAYAEAEGVLVVAAAGNDGPTGSPNYPAALADALAVASYDEGGAVSSFSTRGSYVDVAAPGADILSTFKSGGWVFMSGTSMATPHVAGVAALLLANEPGLTPAQVRQRFESTAVDAGTAGRDPSYGWGRIDAPAVLGLD